MAEWNEGPDDLVVPFIFVPKGSPEPKEWLAQHPGAIRIPATLVPRTSASGGEDQRLHVDLDTVLTQGPAGPWAAGRGAAAENQASHAGGADASATLECKAEQSGCRLSSGQCRA